MRAPIALSAIFLLFVVPAILFGASGGSQADDERSHHLPVIETMARQWPAVDLIGYDSATAPGYHLVLALVWRVFPNLTGLHLLSSLFGLAFVLVVAAAARRVAGDRPATVLCLPLVSSSYVLGGSIWLTTDNAAWLCVAIALALAAFRVGATARSTIAATAGVAIRQIHLWLVAPLAFASSRRPVEMAMAVVPPTVLVLGFAYVWGGLTPPAYRGVHDAGVNLAIVPITLALFGAFGLWYLPLLPWPETMAAVRGRRALAAVIGGAVLCALVPTTYDVAAGRWGGPIWTVAHETPSILGRSLVVTTLGAIGAGILAVLFDRAEAAHHGRAARVVFVALAAWMAAQSMNSQAWQRYAEPMVLMSLAWLTALGMTRHHRAAWAGPLTLAAIQMLISLAAIYGGSGA